MSGYVASSLTDVKASTLPRRNKASRYVYIVVHKKCASKLLSITLANLNRFQ